MQGFIQNTLLKRQLFTNILHYKNLILNLLMSSVQVKLHLKLGSIHIFTLLCYLLFIFFFSLTKKKKPQNI